jgi:hypothetical protein
MARPAAALAAVSMALLLPASAGTTGTPTLTVSIVNQSGRAAPNVYVMLHNGSSSDGKLANGVPKPLSQVAGSRFTLSSISAGRIFFSYGRPVTAAEPPRSDTRYDKIELTYPGVANLTSVDFFGIPFKLETFDSQGRSLGTLSFDAPTQTLKTALLKIPGASGALVKTSSGHFARVLSPQLSRESYPSFDQDIASMAGKRVTIRGAFYGAPYQTFVYSGSFATDGSIRLRGTIAAPNGGSPSPALAVAVAGSTLPQAVYTVDGPYRVGGQPAHVSDNNVYSVIYRDLISGFAAGYMGGKYGNDSANWAGKPPFADARAASTPYATFNEYAAVLYRYSNAYGFSFSDTLPKQIVLPLDDAAMLRITILPDS